MKKLLFLLLCSGVAFSDTLLDRMDINKDGELDEIRWSALSATEIEFKVIVDGAAYTRSIKLTEPAASIDVTGVSAVLGEGNATHSFDVAVNEVDVFPVPLDVISNEFQMDMYIWTIANADSVGFTERYLQTHCLLEGGDEVERKRLVSARWKDHPLNVFWYAPGFDATLSFDIEPSYCEEQPYTGGMFMCYFHFPQNNLTMGYNFASYEGEPDNNGNSATVSTCWRRDFETDF